MGASTPLPATSTTVTALPPTPTVVPSLPEIPCISLTRDTGRLCVQASPAEASYAQVEYCGLPDPSPDFMHIVPADATGRYVWT